METRRRRKIEATGQNRPFCRSAEYLRSRRRCMNALMDGAMIEVHAFQARAAAAQFLEVPMTGLEVPDKVDG